MNGEKAALSSLQEQYVLDALAGIRKLVVYKLGSSHRSSVEDLLHRVFCKLWAWKTRHNKIMEFDEWQKVVRKVAYSEITEYYSEKYSRDIVFSQANVDLRKTLASSSSYSSPEGNSPAELGSVLSSIWKTAQILSLRQRYAFFLQSADFLFEFINGGHCTVRELAEFFDLTEKEAKTVLSLVPLSDKQLCQLLAANFDQDLLPHQIWEAKAKAKARLARAFKEVSKREPTTNEKLFTPKTNQTALGAKAAGESVRDGARTSGNLPGVPGKNQDAE